MFVFIFKDLWSFWIFWNFELFETLKRYNCSFVLLEFVMCFEMFELKYQILISILSFELHPCAVISAHGRLWTFIGFSSKSTRTKYGCEGFLLQNKTVASFFLIALQFFFTYMWVGLRSWYIRRVVICQAFGDRRTKRV